jgi:PAS domain S-box-containing protein
MYRQLTRIRKYGYIAAGVWTIALICSFAWFYYLQQVNLLEIAKAEARISFEKDLLYRKWATGHGGVYVPKTERTPANPYLAHIPERDISTPSGKALTLVNPAYMTRQVFELAQQENKLVRGHITSLNPIRHENAPDPWEKKALEAIAAGEKEVSELLVTGGQQQLRLMRPFITEQGCLKCHAAQGYKVGDIRGGISVTVPISAFTGYYQRLIAGNAAGHVLVWLLGLGMLTAGRRALLKSVAELHESEERYRTVADFTSDWEYWLAPDGRFRYMSPSCEQICGYSRDEFSADPELLLRVIHPEDRHLYAKHVHTMSDGATPQPVDFRIITRSNEVRWVSHVCRDVIDSQGKDAGRRASNRDITLRKNIEEALHEQALQMEQEIAERQVAQEALQEQALLLEEEVAERMQAEESIRSSEEKFSKAFQLAPLIMSISTIEDGTLLEVNDQYVRSFGYSREESLGRTSVELGIFSDDARKKLIKSLGDHNQVSGVELVLHARDGNRLTCLYYGDIINVAGVKRLLSIVVDISEQKKLEEQFRQSQKMEAIGQLAGGVAHDFNNMLTVIQGLSELSRLKVPEGEELWQYLTQITKAAQRSSDITRQLLAFSRKEIVAPRPVNLNELVRDAQKTLFRLIGEDIRLMFQPAAGLWSVRIDPSQMDQILVNLAVNARDAMPNGGVLSIESANVTIKDTSLLYHIDATPGDFVQLTISDSGVGMDKETQEHIFEPFFTTKETGKGTGLGLSTVYGIVTQNKGFITVYSEPGQGTSFRLFFPRIIEEVHVEEKVPVAVPSGTGTVLLVEDDNMVRWMTTQTLELSGYTVIQAESPREAIDLCEKEETAIDLILTDVVMPGMNGREMMEIIRLIRPGIRTLYMSGYTRDLVAQRGVVDEGMHFIQKPFNMTTLVDKINEVMASQVGD